MPVTIKIKTLSAQWGTQDPRLNTLRDALLKTTNQELRSKIAALIKGKTKTEIIALLKGISQLKGDALLKALLSKLSPSNDNFRVKVGNLTLERSGSGEIYAHINGKKVRVTGRLKKWIDNLMRLNGNGDGKITAKELTRAATVITTFMANYGYTLEAAFSMYNDPSVVMVERDQDAVTAARIALTKRLGGDAKKFGSTKEVEIALKGCPQTVINDVAKSCGSSSTAPIVAQHIMRQVLTNDSLTTSTVLGWFSIQKPQPPAVRDSSRAIVPRPPARLAGSPPAPVIARRPVTPIKVSRVSGKQPTAGVKSRQFNALVNRLPKGLRNHWIVKYYRRRLAKRPDRMITSLKRVVRYVDSLRAAKQLAASLRTKSRRARRIYNSLRRYPRITYKSKYRSRVIRALGSLLTISRKVNPPVTRAPQTPQLTREQLLARLVPNPLDRVRRIFERAERSLRILDKAFAGIKRSYRKPRPAPRPAPVVKLGRAYTPPASRIVPSPPEPQIPVQPTRPAALKLNQVAPAVKKALLGASTQIGLNNVYIVQLKFERGKLKAVKVRNRRGRLDAVKASQIMDFIKAKSFNFSQIGFNHSDRIVNIKVGTLIRTERRPIVSRPVKPKPPAEVPRPAAPPKPAVPPLLERATKRDIKSFKRKIIALYRSVSGKTRRAVRARYLAAIRSFGSLKTEQQGQEALKSLRSLYREQQVYIRKVKIKIEAAAARKVLAGLKRRGKSLVSRVGRRIKRNVRLARRYKYSKLRGRLERYASLVKRLKTRIYNANYVKDVRPLLGQLQTVERTVGSMMIVAPSKPRRSNKMVFVPPTRQSSVRRKVRLGSLRGGALRREIGRRARDAAKSFSVNIRRYFSSTNNKVIIYVVSNGTVSGSEELKDLIMNNSLLLTLRRKLRGCSEKLYIRIIKKGAKDFDVQVLVPARKN